VLAGGGTALLLLPEPRVAAEVGSVLATPPPSPSSTSSAEPPSTETSPPVDSRPSTQAPPSTSPAPAGFVPERLVVDAVAIDAPLIATSVDGDGALVPPKDPRQLAWWRGVRPGRGAGSVLVAGHLDMRSYGQGPLARIVRLAPGDRAVLTGAGGSTASYVLRGITTIPKDALPAAELFGTDGPERLVLVTCGGTYDWDLRSWDSNVIAVLDPVPTT